MLPLAVLNALCSAASWPVASADGVPALVDAPGAVVGAGAEAPVAPLLSGMSLTSWSFSLE